MRSSRPHFATIAVAAGLLAAMPAAAALVPAGCLGAADPSSCGLQQIVDTFVIVANYIFGISGSLAFLMFVLGGFYWLSAGGSEERIKKGKTFVVNAAIGLVIIFGARALVNFLVLSVAPKAPAPVEGLGCGKAIGGVTPHYVRVGEELKCVTDCEDLKSASKKKYECGAPVADGDCETNLCPGGKDNVCCVR